MSGCQVQVDPLLVSIHAPFPNLQPADIFQLSQTNLMPGTQDLAALHMVSTRRSDSLPGSQTAIYL